MQKCICGGRMSLGIRIVPKPYRFHLSCDCGHTEEYHDIADVKDKLDRAITDAILTVAQLESEAA